MLQVRIPLIRVQAALKHCAHAQIPVFSYTKLFVRDFGSGWFEQRHRLAFGRDE